MAEIKAAEKAKKKAEAAPEGESAHEKKKRETKQSRWTPETCAKAAKRFDSRQDWQHGHPSSFKAAAARGWDAECCKHMKATAVKTTTKKAPVQVAAKKKPVGKLPKSA